MLNLLINKMYTGNKRDICVYIKILSKKTQYEIFTILYFFHIQ